MASAPAMPVTAEGESKILVQQKTESAAQPDTAKAQPLTPSMANLLVEPMKAAAAKSSHAEIGGAQPGIVETTAATETASGDRPAPTPAAGSNPTTIFSAALQPVTAGQAVPTEGPAASAPAGEIIDPVLEQQLDLAHEGEWLDRLARDIARSAGAEGGLRFRLNPEHLGTLHV